jgi:hypothetical protein
VGNRRIGLFNFTGKAEICRGIFFRCRSRGDNFFVHYTILRINGAQTEEDGQSIPLSAG